MGKLLRVSVLPAPRRLAKNPDVFLTRYQYFRTEYTMTLRRTMSKEDLALTLGGVRVGVGVRLAELIVGFHVDKRALPERAEIVVGVGEE